MRRMGANIRLIEADQLVGILDHQEIFCVVLFSRFREVAGAGTNGERLFC
jgi:hypothetical protein